MVAPFLSLVGGLGDLWPWPGGASPAAAAVLGGGGLLAVITTGPPESAMTFAASAPNAPVAPVMTAVLPLTLNSDSGSFRKSSDIPRLLGRRKLRRRRGDRDENGADLVAAIDDLAAFIRNDVAAIVLAQ